MKTNTRGGGVGRERRRMRLRQAAYPSNRQGEAADGPSRLLLDRDDERACTCVHAGATRAAGGRKGRGGTETERKSARRGEASEASERSVGGERPPAVTLPTGLRRSLFIPPAPSRPPRHPDSPPPPPSQPPSHTPPRRAIRFAPRARCLSSSLPPLSLCSCPLCVPRTRFPTSTPTVPTLLSLSRVVCVSALRLRTRVSL